MWIPVVDPMKCVGCGKCAEVCPEEAIEIVNKKSVIDYNDCTCCGVCDRVCQTEALKFKNPKMPAIMTEPENFKEELSALKQLMRGMKRELRIKV